jgi:hypothetical protein
MEEHVTSYLLIERASARTSGWTSRLDAAPAPTPASRPTLHVRILPAPSPTSGHRTRAPVPTQETHVGPSHLPRLWICAVLPALGIRTVTHGSALAAAIGIAAVGRCPLAIGAVQHQIYL